MWEIINAQKVLFRRPEGSALLNSILEISLYSPQNIQTMTLKCPKRNNTHLRMGKVAAIRQGFTNPRHQVARVRPQHATWSVLPFWYSAFEMAPRMWKICELQPYSVHIVLPFRPVCWNSIQSSMVCAEAFAVLKVCEIFNFSYFFK